MMQDVDRDLRRLGLQAFAGMIEATAASAGDSGAERRQPRLLRPHERLGARRGPARPRLYLLRAPRAAPGPIANNIGPERSEKSRAQLGLGDGDAVFFVAGEPKSCRTSLA